MNRNRNQQPLSFNLPRHQRLPRWFAVPFVSLGCLALIPQLIGQTVGPAAPTFTQTNLVSNAPGKASTVDANLVNPWGMAVGINSGLWVGNHGSGVATTYDGTGQPIPASAPVSAVVPG